MPSRNAESHFSMLPRNQFERSKFQIEHTHKTTFNAGKLIPFFCEMDVLPGDTYKMTTSAIIRMSTPKYPVMDNCYADFYYFFIPNRLVWEHWKEFNGENRNGAWTNSTEYEIPTLTTPIGGALTGTLMDYFGIPIGVENIEFNALPIRAYVLTWNEWFRDQNVTAPLTENTGDANATADNENPVLGGTPLSVYKYHDYFTSCLPQPQKGEAITSPLGTTAPVVGNGQAIGVKGTNTGVLVARDIGTDAGIVKGVLFGTNNENMPNGTLYKFTNSTGLEVDLTQATASTINALRLAFATQRILEKDARGGTRYTEIVRNHFGVISPDARQQRPEYLGGKRVPINMQQVVQTSSTIEGVSAQGNTAAMSLTGDTDNSFTKSFTEHGIILGLVCIRQDHTYQQGLERGWSRKRRLDYYWPSLAHLGEQPVLMKELYARGTNADNEVFGYQERWAEYRYKPNRISGEFRSTYDRPLDSWHYGDLYEDAPVLSTEFLQETAQYIDRTLTVTSTLQNQFIADFYMAITAVRPMPIYSVPGLLDHF